MRRAKWYAQLCKKYAKLKNYNMNQEITAIVLVCKNCNEIRKYIVKQTSTFEKIESFKLLAINDNVREISILTLAKFPLRCKCKQP